MNKNQVIHFFKTLLKEELEEDAYLLTFKDTENPANHEEMVVRLADGKEFQVTMDKSNITVKRKCNAYLSGLTWIKTKIPVARW